MERVAGLRGRKSPYFSPSGAGLRTPIRIPGIDVFVEGNVSARTAERLARRTVETIRGSDHDFSIEHEGEAVPASNATPSIETPDTRGASPAGENFTGLRPAAYWLDGKRYKVARWNEVLHGVCARLAREAGSDFGKLVTPIRGRTRVYFSENADELHFPLQLSNSPCAWTETSARTAACASLAASSSPFVDRTKPSALSLQETTAPHDSRVGRQGFPRPF